MATHPCNNIIVYRESKTRARELVRGLQRDGIRNVRTRKVFTAYGKSYGTPGADRTEAVFVYRPLNSSKLSGKCARPSIQNLDALWRGGGKV